jgi:hypothetical protein
MPPFFGTILARSPILKPGVPSDEFSAQWTHPGDVFSVLLILGGDVVGRALAQCAGGWLRPPSFSFGECPLLSLVHRRSSIEIMLTLGIIGWVAYSINALVSTVGENKLMPLPDCACIAINGKSGYSRSNSSWILGRMVRDYESWMDSEIEKEVRRIVNDKWDDLKQEARKAGKPEPERPKQAGLCVSTYEPVPGMKYGEPVYDGVFYFGYAIAFVQLGIASIPCGLFGDWGILMLTACGIILSSLTASLPQWKSEKWACRRLPVGGKKKVVLTRGNRCQHAIVILGREGFLDLEDLAGGRTNVDVSISTTTRVIVAGLALLWVLLLITAAGLKQNTWFLLAIGGIGILQNIIVAGLRRNPRAFSIPIKYVGVFGDKKVMNTLYAVEEAYPNLGRSMRDTFFPGKLNSEEQRRWDEYGT